MSRCKGKMMIFSRVVGFYSQTNEWNPGKQEEFAMRKTFKLEKSLKRKESLDKLILMIDVLIKDKEAEAQ